MAGNGDLTEIRGPLSLPMHDIVVAAAMGGGYRTLAGLIADRGRIWVQEHGEPLTLLSGDDPQVAALILLADALVRLKQASNERAPGAEQAYQAVLLVAGHLSKAAPLATYRRDTNPGRAA